MDLLGIPEKQDVLPKWEPIARKKLPKSIRWDLLSGESLENSKKYKILHILTEEQINFMAALSFMESSLESYHGLSELHWHVTSLITSSLDAVMAPIKN